MFLSVRSLRLIESKVAIKDFWTLIQTSLVKHFFCLLHLTSPKHSTGTMFFSRILNICPTVIFFGLLLRTYPPETPLFESTNPAFSNFDNIFSKKSKGISSFSEIILREQKPSFFAKKAIARKPYCDCFEILIKKPTILVGFKYIRSRKSCQLQFRQKQLRYLFPAALRVWLIVVKMADPELYYNSFLVKNENMVRQSRNCDCVAFS